MSKSKNLAGYELRSNSIHKDSILETYAKLGVQFRTQHQRAGVAPLIELLPVIEKAKADNLSLDLPSVPHRELRRKFSRTDVVEAYTKYDALNIALLALGEYGMTAGIASQFSAIELTDILKSF